MTTLTFVSIHQHSDCGILCVHSVKLVNGWGKMHGMGSDNYQ